jgi:hypothetical protein
MNSKAIFKPSLKKLSVIILDEEVTDEVPKNPGKGKKQMSQPNLVSSHS